MVEAHTANVPPHSAQAEQSLLGAVLMDNRAFEAVGDMLAPDDFYVHEHRQMWRVMHRLLAAGRPADVVTVYDALDAQGLAEELGGLAYINDVAMCVASAANAKAYAGAVRHWALCRALITVGRDIEVAARVVGEQAAAVDKLIDGALLRLMDLQKGALQDEPRALQALLPGWIDDLQARAAGKTDAIKTGLHDVDRLLAGGMRRGEVVVIGARPSMGKSALMLTVARNVSASGPVLACSMEDSEQMLVARQVAAAGRANLADLRAPDRAPDALWEQVAEGVERLSALDLHIDDKPALTLHEVRRKAMQVRRRRGDLLLVIVDYLQLMEGEGETRAQELTTVARGMKRLAKEMGCVVMLLSQLNREADKLEGPPRLDHLAESGGIEQAADIIGLLWREARRKPKPGNKHKAQIEFAKNKNGPTDTVQLWFDGATQRFEDAIHGGEYAQ